MKEPKGTYAILFVAYGLSLAGFIILAFIMATQTQQLIELAGKL